MSPFLSFFFFFFNDPAPTEIYPLSLHDALPISLEVFPLARALERNRQLARQSREVGAIGLVERSALPPAGDVEDPEHVRRRSEEHTSELQSQSNLVCRLLLEKKKKKITCT